MLGPFAAADQRLGRNLMGQTRLDRPPKPERTGMADPSAECARHGLQIQRYPGERARAGVAEHLAATVAGGFKRKDHGPDRSFAYLALDRLRKFLGGNGWTTGTIGKRRIALGRWVVY